MDPIPPPSPEDEQRRQAEANWLLERGRDRGVSPLPPKTPPPAPAEGYSLEGSEANDDTVTQIIPPIPSPPARERRPDRDAAGVWPKPVARPAAAVSQTWSRWAEWGPTLRLLAAVGLTLVLVLYLALASGFYSLAFLLVLAGGATLMTLSYPIAITLERPVRITPEQAVTDYFTALSHHRPHYRRMWLLLSDDGRASAASGSFEAFKTHWNEWIARQSGEDPWRISPLTFEVVDFRSEKSAGLSVLDATYTVNVLRRGADGGAPIATWPIKTGLVKGPDRMWYLNTGTLPGGP